MDWEGEREIEKSEVGRDEERLRENGRWTEDGQKEEEGGSYLQLQ